MRGKENFQDKKVLKLLIDELYINERIARKLSVEISESEGKLSICIQKVVIHRLKKIQK